jgi:hypothetical protein
LESASVPHCGKFAESKVKKSAFDKRELRLLALLSSCAATLTIYGRSRRVALIGHITGNMPGELLLGASGKVMHP